MLMDFNNNKEPLKPLKWYKKLFSYENRIEEGIFIIEGERSVRQIADFYPSYIIEILATEKAAAGFTDFPVRILNEKQMSSISTATTPQGIMAVVRLPADIYSDRLPTNAGEKILLLEHVQDPGNTGTLIRTAAAFGFSGIIMSRKCADPLSAKVVQSTAGSVLSLWIRSSGNYLNMIKELQKNKYQLVAADLNGDVTPEVLKQKKRLILALGNEASGLSPQAIEMADARVKIPVDREKAESLNVAVSGAILMYAAVNPFFNKKTY
jgi:TrmH family RNA methyltransferase